MTKKYALIRSVTIKKVDIASQRIKSGLSVRQMAIRIGVSYPLYSRMENGLRYMSVVQYNRFTDAIKKINEKIKK